MMSVHSSLLPSPCFSRRRVISRHVPISYASLAQLDSGHQPMQSGAGKRLVVGQRGRIVHLASMIGCLTPGHRHRTRISLRACSPKLLRVAANATSRKVSPVRWMTNQQWYLTIHPIGSSHRVLAPPLLDPSHRFIHDQCGWLQVSDVITLPMKLTPSRCRCAAFSSVRVYDHLQSSSVIFRHLLW